MANPMAEREGREIVAITRPEAWARSCLGNLRLSFHFHNMANIAGQIHLQELPSAPSGYPSQLRTPLTILVS